MNSWSATLNIRPTPVQSARFSRFGGAYQAPKKKAYISQLRGMILERFPTGTPKLTGPLCLEIDFVFPFRKQDEAVTKDASEIIRFRHTETPDEDNLVKGVQDALKGIVFEDDSVICLHRLQKYRERGIEDGQIKIVVTMIDYGPVEPLF